MKTTIVSIDPGASGGIAWIHPNGKAACEPMPETDLDVFAVMESIMVECVSDNQVTPICYIENVHSMPKQGVASSFSFGRNFGFLMGVLTALGYRIELITPQKWMKTMGIGTSKGLTKTQWKRKLKQKAQQLYPELMVWKETKGKQYAVADALLILEYGVRQK